MSSKSLEDYYLQVYDLLLDVVKLNGSFCIEVMLNSSLYAIYTIGLDLMSTNIVDKDTLSYVTDTVKRNYSLLLDRSKELA